MDSTTDSSCISRFLGEPAPIGVLSDRLRHALEDELNAWDEGDRTPDRARALHELAAAHRQLADLVAA